MKQGILYSDGGARGNPGPAAIGVIVCNAKGEILQEHGEVIGETTNNVAEYTALIVGFDLARKLGFTELKCFGDSQLVMCQLSGQYKVKTEHIRSLYNQVKILEKSFEKVSYSQIPRTHDRIRYVDRLVNQALDQEGY